MTALGRGVAHPLGQLQIVRRKAGHQAQQGFQHEQRKNNAEKDLAQTAQPSFHQSNTWICWGECSAIWGAPLCVLISPVIHTFLPS